MESDRRSALALEEIGIAIKGIASRFSGIETRMETEAVDVAVAVARKLCSELVSREPLGEITALVSDCFSHLYRRRTSWSRSTTTAFTKPRAKKIRSGLRSRAASRAGCETGNRNR